MNNLPDKSNFISINNVNVGKDLMWYLCRGNFFWNVDVELLFNLAYLIDEGSVYNSVQSSNRGESISLEELPKILGSSAAETKKLVNKLIKVAAADYIVLPNGNNKPVLIFNPILFNKRVGIEVEEDVSEYIIHYFNKRMEDILGIVKIEG